MLNTVRNKFSLPASWNRVFMVTLVFVTLAAGLFWLDFFRRYNAEVVILVVSRPGASQSGADVAGNLAGLTQTLSFYDRVLADNDFIEDAFLGYASDKRKALWNDTVSVKKFKGSSILTLRAVGNTPEEATVLARQTAQTLFSIAGFYYNVKTDIDLRIIDGPLLGYVVVKPLLFGVTSLLTGFSVTALFFLLLQAMPEFIVPRKKEISLDEILAKQDAPREKYVRPEKFYSEFSLGETVPWIDPKKFIPAKPATLSFENITQGAKKIASVGQRAPAPANLPVASSAMDLPVMDRVEPPFEFEAMPAELDVTFSQNQDEPMVPLETSEPTMTPQRGEPTVDEYKRRLNKLLSGNN